jgi:hypothetical protein
VTFQRWLRLMSETVGLRRNNDFEYRVRMYALHGPMLDVFVVAPDAFQAHQIARERYPGCMVQSILRVAELFS